MITSGIDAVAAGPAPPLSEDLAFLGIREAGELGFLGGLLIVNGLGRPLAFHCSAPVHATRTQSILFGASLTSFLYCDQIGTALLQHLTPPPSILVVQESLLLSLGEASGLPIVWIPPDDRATPGPQIGAAVPCHTFSINEQVRYTTARAEDLPWVTARCQRFSDHLPMDEPFERIQQALEYALAQAR